MVGQGADYCGLYFVCITSCNRASDMSSSFSIYSSGNQRHKRELRYQLILPGHCYAGFLYLICRQGSRFLVPGFLQKKNTLNYLAMSFMDFCIGAIVFWAFGFALMFGGSYLAYGLDSGNTLIGHSGFFLAFGSFDYSTSKLWLFQMMFAAAASTIIAGSVAERIKFNTHILMHYCSLRDYISNLRSLGMGWRLGLQICPFGSGMKDFAGSGVVHGIGGLIALVGAWHGWPQVWQVQS